MVKTTRLGMFEELAHRKLVAELRKGERANTPMVFLAYRADVADIRWAIFRERLNMVKLNLGLVVDGMVIDKAVEFAFATLLRKDLRFSGSFSCRLMEAIVAPSPVSPTNPCLCCLPKSERHSLARRIRIAFCERRPTRWSVVLLNQ